MKMSGELVVNAVNATSDSGRPHHSSAVYKRMWQRSRSGICEERKGA